LCESTFRNVPKCPMFAVCNWTVIHIKLPILWLRLVVAKAILLIMANFHVLAILAK